MSYEFNILYYMNIYKKSWKIILYAVIIAMVLTFCLSILSPTVYVSSATLLRTGGSAISSSDSALSRLFGMNSGSSAMDTIISVMTSRRMANDARDHFKLDEKPKFWWRINPAMLQGGVVEIRGPDPVLTQQIVDFCIQNLDKINVELDITPNKPMVRVLDSATYGSPLPKQIPRRVFVAGMLTFLVASLYIFSMDYYKKLKGQQIP